MTQTSNPYPPGARIVVREAEWMVRSCTATEHDGFKIRATGVSELVRDEDAVFFTELENPKPLLLKPEETVLVPDQTPRFAMSRLFLEATLRRTPLPQSERGLALPDGFLLDPLTYQQRPAELALNGLRPRVLLADVVGLGKTLEMDEPVRVLLTGDVASEGVNMHRQCHHLIHYDLPWSLIRIEQRNGRIDRYGQEHQPEFAALILTSQIEGAKDDTTVAEKLLHREEQAHHSLGTAEGITREFTARKEEDRLVKDLLAGKTVDESIEAASTVDDFLADLLAGVGDQPGAAEPPRADVPNLFTSTEAFAREALDFACPTLHIDDDGEMLAFEPPDDLVQRLAVLPPNYLKKHKVAERMKVTFDRRLAQRKLDEARQTKTLWPDIAFLSDLHPMIEWLTDKVLLRITRQQAPVIIADVNEPAFLVQGVYSNALGQPTVVQWMAITGLPDEPRVAGLTQTLKQAGVGPGMVNTLQFGDIVRLQKLVPVAVKAARAHLEARREAYDRAVDEPLNEYRERVKTWRQDSLLDVAAQFRSRREQQVDETADRLNKLLTELHTAGDPLLRILAVLDGAR